MQAAEQQNHIPAADFMRLFLTFLVAFFSDSRVYKRQRLSVIRLLFIIEIIVPWMS